MGFSDTGAFDVDYIEAVLNDDAAEVSRIETFVQSLSDVGPLATCTTVTNVTTQRSYCRELRIYNHPNQLSVIVH